MTSDQITWGETPRDHLYEHPPVLPEGPWRGDEGTATRMPVALDEGALDDPPAWLVPGTSWYDAQDGHRSSLLPFLVGLGVFVVAVGAGFALAPAAWEIVRGWVG